MKTIASAFSASISPTDVSGNWGVKSVENSNNRKLRVAVVGLGKMGLLHASLLKTLPEVELVAICDKSRLMRTIASSNLKNILVTDGLSPFSDLNLDAVYVTTPIPSHYGIIKEVYSQRIASNLFVEKTLSSSPLLSEELLGLSSKSRGVTMVGYMKRFSVTFKKAKELVNRGILGEPYSFKAYACSSDFVGIQNDSSVSKARGGVLVDLGAHVIDLALWLFGDQQVKSATIQSVTGASAVDSVEFSVIGQRKTHGSFSISWVKGGYRMPEFGLSVEGDKGTMTVDDSSIRLKINNSKPEEWYRQNLSDNVPFLLAEPEYFREDKSFVDSVINKVEGEPNFNTGLKVDSLIAEVERKANEQ